MNPSTQSCLVVCPVDVTPLTGLLFDAEKLIQRSFPEENFHEGNLLEVSVGVITIILPN